MASMTDRVRKAALFTLMGLLIMAAGLISYFAMPRPIGRSTLLLAMCLFVGFIDSVIGLYLFLAGDAKVKDRMTGKKMGAGLSRMGETV